MYIFRYLAIALSCLTLLACASQPDRSAPGALPRADPGYVQWLERQSLLNAAPQLTTLVSGTEKSLHATVMEGEAGKGDRIDVLLTAADTWLWLHAPTMITQRLRPVWEELIDPQNTLFMDALGLRGIYVAATGESGAIWEQGRKRSTGGDEVTSFFFSPQVGSDKQFAAFARLAAQRQWQTGADLIPPATGLGPDFFLAARQVREYPGLYMMLEAPEKLWSQLPKAETQWSAAALDDNHVALLTKAGVLPPSLARDHLKWAAPGGWAITGEVRGTDGASRRWVYRYHRNPQRPQLHWDDPSGSARKILSASIIRQVGLLQHTLGGLHLEPLAGLEPAAANTVSPTIEPAPSALRDMAREVRRYGGWSVQLDTLPATINAPLHQQGADFSADPVTAPAAELALRKGDATALREALRTSLEAGVDHRRYLRTITGFQGLTALGGAPESTDEDKTRLAQQHRLLALFRAGLPGLLFLSANDLTGTLADEEKTGWSLSLPPRMGLVTRRGAGRAPVAYQAVSEQLVTAGSFADTMRKAIAARREWGISRARLHSLANTTSNASVGLWLTLPGQGMALVLGNFSNKPVTEKISLPPQAKGRIRNVLDNTDASLNLTLEPWQCLWLVVGGQ